MNRWLYLLIFVPLGCLLSCQLSSDAEPNTYAVSGRVINEEGFGLSSVTLQYGTDSTITNNQGFWSIQELSGENTLIPVKSGYTFEPAQLLVTGGQVNLDFLGIPVPPDYVALVISWFRQLQLANGLLESTENSNFVSLYDNALAALVFINDEEYERAEKIFDFFNARIDSELRSGKGGFSQFRDRNGVPGYHRWLGDNAWLLIALNNYKEITGNTQYEVLATELGNWIQSLQNSEGGVWGGYNSDGSLIQNVVTEGNIDAFNAIPGYTDFHSKLLNYLENNLWDPVDQNLLAWPDNPPYKYAMDNHPWGYCILEDFPVSALTSASRYVTTKTMTATGTQITGYCFDVDKDNVWFEGTGLMVVAFQQAEMVEEANFYLEELEKAVIPSSSFQQAAGIPYTSNLGTHYATSELWIGADTKLAISSGAWYLFGKRGFNPFEVGANKDVPLADRFWKN